MKIIKVWLEGDYIYGNYEMGNIYKQSLLWYPRLKAASDEQRSHYELGPEGIHWRGLDEDISFESFTYDDACPSPMQRFFLTHQEINVAGFAKRIGLNASVLNKYIKGMLKPSAEVEKNIVDAIHRLGKEMVAACF